MLRSRALLIAGIAALVLGLVIRAMMDAPPVEPPRSIPDIQRILEFQRTQRPAADLEPRYREFAAAFLFTGSREQVDAIKRAIDEELAATAAIKERGLAAAFDAALEKLAAPDLVLIGIGAALLFRTLAFVLGVGFFGGIVHAVFLTMRTFTGLASELFLGAILAGMALAVAAWAIRAAYEGRLRASP